MKKAALHSIVSAEVHFLPWGLAKEVAQNVSCFQVLNSLATVEKQGNNYLARREWRGKH